MNSRTYDYRVIKTSWGIEVSLTARVVPAEGVRDTVWSTRLVGLAYALEDRDVLPAENEQFVLALRALAPRIETRIKDPIVIEVQQISYMPTDFQIEGIR